MFFGWLVVAAAFVAHCVTTGVVFYSFGVFLPVLSDDLGWSRAQVALGFSLVALCSSLYGPWVGRIVDRHGSRPSQLCGVFVMAAGFLLLSRLNSLIEFYALLAGVVALGAAATAPLPSDAAVARWFVRRRGLALGIATTGISMGGVVFVPLTRWLVDSFGWRGAFARLAGIIVVATLPPVVAFMRRSPESMGLLPDGAVVGEATLPGGVAAPFERSWTPDEAWRHRSFWLIAAAFAVASTGVVATLLHLVSFLRDLGVPAREASWLLGTTAGMGVLGKLGFGALMGRLEQRQVIATCFLLQSVGHVLLLAVPNASGLLPFVIVYGFAMGGTVTLNATFIAECFGRLHFGAIAGRMMPFVVGAQAAGLPLVGASRDLVGSYLPAFVGIAVANLLAAWLILLVRPERKARRSEASG